VTYFQVRNLMIDMDDLYSLLSLILILLCLLVVPLRLLYRSINERKRYKETSYYKITRNPYSVIKQDSGKYGEYLIYKHLEHFEKIGGMFLFNLYVPKSSSGTTEIDVLLICPKGIFVFESKNYGGWVFGNENHKYWTQTLPSGWNGACHKERFYNPIMQNATHIKHLRHLIDENVPIRSIIVFSDRSTLKEVTLINKEINVINCNNVFSAVNQACKESENDLLTQFEIYNIYNRLYPYTQTTAETRQAHQDNLQRFFT
jgi:hypothetical protein